LNEALSPMKVVTNSLLDNKTDIEDLF